MVDSDGHRYQHGPKPGDKRPKKPTEYDKIWDVLKHAELIMWGDHGEKGSSFELRDRNYVKVGTVTFDKTDAFVAASFYTEVFVSGRVHNKREAYHAFMNRIEKTHGRR